MRISKNRLDTGSNRKDLRCVAYIQLESRSLCLRLDSGLGMAAGMSRRPSWGAGRVAFLARLEAIKADLSAGITLKIIHEKHQAALKIGYASFCRLVSRYAANARPVPFLPPRRRSPMNEPPRQTSADLTKEDHARHCDTGHPSFDYNPNPSTADKARLIGDGSDNGKT